MGAGSVGAPGRLSDGLSSGGSDGRPEARPDARPDGLPLALPAGVRALLVDLDGTLLDTEPVWSAAAHALADAWDAPWSGEDDRCIVGWSVPAVAALLRERGVPLDEAAVVAALHDGVAERLGGAVPWRPGARELLAAARAAGLGLALVTMSHRRLTRAVAGSFDVVVAGDDVTRPKPHPEPYLTAARLLGVAPDACVVVEDSPTGVAAGLAAGCRVVAVDPAQPVPPGDRLARSTLPALTAALLAPTATHPRHPRPR